MTDNIREQLNDLEERVFDIETSGMSFKERSAFIDQRSAEKERRARRDKEINDLLSKAQTGLKPHAIPESGLLDDELAIMTALSEAWNQYNDMNGRVVTPHNVDDLSDFRRAIHTCQRIIATHAMHRMFGKYWK